MPLAMVARSLRAAGALRAAGGRGWAVPVDIAPPLRDSTLPARREQVKAGPPRGSLLPGQRGPGAIAATGARVATFAVHRAPPVRRQQPPP